MTNSSENIFHTCRSCVLLSNDTYPIFETVIEDNISIVRMLNYFLMEIEEDDLPPRMCHSCLMKLQAAYEFFEMFKKSQGILQQRFVDNQEEHIVILNDESNLNVFFKNNKDDTSMEQNFSEAKGNATDIEESIIIKYGESDKESHDSDDEEYLIAKSVQLTDMYKNRKWDNGTDTDSDDNTIEAEDDQINFINTKKKPSSSNPSIGHVDVHSEDLEDSNVQMLTCTECSTCFTDVKSYLNHNCEDVLHCNICDKSFPTDAYKRHMQRHSNSQKRLTCPAKNCSKTFSGKQGLQSHYLTIHDVKRNYLCSLCGASFKNYDNLRYHIKKHDGPSHLCTYCGKAFMLSAHLKDHMWIHLGVKPHKCTKCDKSFSTKRMLKRHMERNCGKIKRQRRQKLLLNIEST